MADSARSQPGGLLALLSAGMISRTGDWLLRAGLVFAAYRLTGSTTVTGLAALSSLAPQVCLGGVAGGLADRWDQRRTMVIVNLAAAGCLLPLLLVDSASRVWIVYVVAFTEAGLAQFFTPAEAALLPVLAGEDRVVEANGWNGQVINASRLVGSAGGGLLVGSLGLSSVALVDSGSYLVAAAFLLLIRSSTTSSPDMAQPPRASRRSLEQVRHRPILLTLVAFSLVTYIGQGVMSTLFVPFVSSVLHAGGTTYGLVLAAQAVGGIVGGGVVGMMSSRWGLWQTFAVAAAAFGFGDLVLFLYPLAIPEAWPAIGLMVGVGIPGAVSVAAMTALLQKASPGDGVGRTFGVVAVAQGIGELLGIGLATTVTPSVGIIPVIAVQGLGYLVCGLAMVYLGRHRLRPLLTGVTPGLRRVDARRRRRLLVASDQMHLLADRVTPLHPGQR